MLFYSIERIKVQNSVLDFNYTHTHTRKAENLFIQLN